MSSAIFDQLLVLPGPFLIFQDTNTGKRKDSNKTKVRENVCLVFDQFL